MPDAVFDAHLHLFSRVLFETLAAQAPGEGTVDEKIARFSAKTKVDVPSSDLAAHVARWLAEFDRHGVARSVAFASVPEEADAVAEAAAIAKGRLIPVALVNPLAPGAPDRVRLLLRRRGFRGVLLFPAMHRYRVGGPEARAVFEQVAECMGVAYVSCGLLKVPARDAFGLPRTTDLQYANPLDLVPVADAFPATTFLVPHLGAGFFRETLMLGTQCANVVADTSSSNGWLATEPTGLSLAGALRRALAVFGPDRLLFGTDSSTFPRGWRADLLASQRAAYAEAGLSPTDSTKVFRTNAERLFSLA